MRNVLVLNADGSPINIIRPERAIRLLWHGKVIVVDTSAHTMRSATTEINIPSVIMLKDYKKIKYRDAKLVTRRGVFARDLGICQYCGKAAQNIDHVLPTSKGGLHEWRNVVAACIPCNSKKSDRTPEEAGMRLLSEPKEPHRFVHLRRQNMPEWDRYLGLTK